jgi:hypothetical protein
MKALPCKEDGKMLSGPLNPAVTSLMSTSVLTRLCVSVSASSAPNDRHEVALIQLLMPHFGQAFGVTQRLREQRNKVSALQSALDWLADGVALLAADGTVLYANARKDGIAIARRAIRLSSPAAAEHLVVALGAVSRLRAGDPTAAIHDFSVTAVSGADLFLVGAAGHPSRRREALAAWRWRCCSCTTPSSAGAAPPRSSARRSA